MKNLNDSKLEDEMVKNLKSLEVNPPDGLWDDIEATLNARNRKRIILFVSWASAATIALLFTIGGFYMVDKRSENNLPISKNSQNLKIDTTKKIENTNNKGIELSQVPTEAEKPRFVQRSVSRNIQDITTVQAYDIAAKVDSIPLTLAPILASLNNENKEVTNKIQIKADKTREGITISITNEDDSKQKVNKEWIVSASGFPVYSFHTSGATDKSINNREMGIVSWGGSISVRRAITRNLSLESGIIYNVLGQQEKNIYLVFSDNGNPEVLNYPGLINSYGLLSVNNTQLKVMDTYGLDMLTTNAVNNSNFNKVNALQQFRYLEIPILLVKNYSIKGINIFLKGGLSAGFLVGNLLELSNSKITLKGKTKGVDPFVASTIASLGLSIPILHNINFSIEPSFRLGLNSLSTPSGKSYPFSTYIKFGIEVPLR